MKNTWAMVEDVVLLGAYYTQRGYVLGTRCPLDHDGDHRYVPVREQVPAQRSVDDPVRCAGCGHVLSALAAGAVFDGRWAALAAERQARA